jgi:hypothetical protein
MSKTENPSSRESTFSAARELGQMARALEKRLDEDMIEFINEDEELTRALVRGATDVDIARGEEENRQDT